jgi:hypothetical protein
MLEIADLGLSELLLDHVLSENLALLLVGLQDQLSRGVVNFQSVCSILNGYGLIFDELNKLDALLQLHWLVNSLLLGIQLLLVFLRNLGFDELHNVESGLPALILIVEHILAKLILLFRKSCNKP